MKKLLYGILSSVVLFACSVDNEELTPNQEDLTYEMAQAKQGTYYGMFTTLDSKYRAKVKIDMSMQEGDAISNATPIALLTLQDGTMVKAVASSYPNQGEAISNLTFNGDDLSFNFSVDSDGSNPTITQATYLSTEADMVVIKSMLAPVTLTGTYECLDCGTHPTLGTGASQTFNIMYPTDNAGDQNDITTQIVLGANVFVSNSGNTQDNCSSQVGKTTCDITGTSVNGNVVWTGTHTFAGDGSCESVSGTWDFDSNYGVLSGTFISDAPVCKQTLLFEDFNDFTGSGFSPSPIAGQLDSNVYIATGLSDGDVNYGDTQTSGDFARGSSTGGVTSGGIYSFEVAAGDFSWGAQPAGSDFTPGTFEVRVENTTGSYLSTIYLNGDLYVNNNEGRSNSANIFYSRNGVDFIPMTPVTNFATEEASDSDGFQLAFQLDKEVDVSGDPLEPGEYIYFRLESDDVSGSGSRDEIAIDNILVEGM